jgi:hypothetical protein
MVRFLGIPPGHLRGVLTRERADGESISSELLRYRDEGGHDWADIIDMLTVDPKLRRKVVRLGCAPPSEASSLEA